MATSPSTKQEAVARPGPPAKPRVAVLHTTPETVLEDIGLAMRMAGYQSVLSPEAETLLQINISWQYYYPACSTAPWQLEGVIKTLRDDGYDNLIPAHNGTVVVDPVAGTVRGALLFWVFLCNQSPSPKWSNKKSTVRVQYVTPSSPSTL